jgi:hypothetical protein
MAQKMAVQMAVWMGDAMVESLGLSRVALKDRWMVALRDRWMVD